MKDRFRSAVFLLSRNPTRNFVYFPSGKEKNSTWKMQTSHCPVRNQAENQIPHWFLSLSNWSTSGILLNFSYGNSKRLAKGIYI